MKTTLKNYVLAALAIVLLAKCTNEKAEKLEGIWRLEKITINGTELEGGSLGNQLWEFNDTNGYLILIAGAKEKGKFRIKDEKLFLKSATEEKKPETEYSIAKLDSTALHLSAEYEKNKSYLTFTKVEGGEVEGEDD